MFIETLENRQLLAGVGEAYAAPVDPRLSIDLSKGWKFIRQNVTGAQATSFNDTSWSSVNVPHTWNNLDAQDGGSNYYRGVGWYRRKVTVPSMFSGKSILLKFDGASMVTNLYVDGATVGSHSGGFAAFSFDVSTKLAPGTHTIAVKVDNSSSLSANMPPNGGDFPAAGGIYRKVSLIGTDLAHIQTNDMASPGVAFSTPSVSIASAAIKVKTGLTNNAKTSQSMLLRSILVDDDGVIVAQSDKTQTLSAGQTFSVTQNATVDNPHLWQGRTDPYLYDLYVEVRDPVSGQLRDMVKQRVGIRSYQISPSQGFLLNGIPYDLHGVNMHQDRLDKGWAISDANIQQDISMVLEVGATMLRLAHYQHSDLVYRLADENGLVIWTEIPLNASSSSGSVPTTTTFQNASAQQLKELIRQNFNHPSVIVWGIFNELADNTANRALVGALNAVAKAEDPTRPTTSATWNKTLKDLDKIPDTLGFNWYYGWYYGAVPDLAGQLDSAHAANPSRALGVSEYGAGASIYQHQYLPPNPTAGGKWHPEEYQNLYHEQTWAILETRNWLWTKLVWNMFDFGVDARGEGDTSGRNDKGLVTYDRQTRKDSFFFYKANWSDDPVLYITSRRWTQRKSPVVEVKVYANVENPQLSVNGAALGALTGGINGVWTMPDVTLQPGNNTLTVTGTRNGQTFSNVVVWQYTPAPSPSAVAIKVNFQPNDTAPVPAGYLVDSGLVYGSRGAGRTYGWNASNTLNTLRRNVAADRRYDTFIHLQRNGSFTWEYALPNGTYDVFLAAGDPSVAESINTFAVEGMLAFDIDGIDKSDTNYIRVNVTDGRLTIAPTKGGVNAKLQFIEIAPVTLAAPVGIASQFVDVSPQSMSVKFNEPMDWTSVVASDLSATLQETGEVFTPSNISYSLSANTVTFIFADALPAGTYAAEVVAGAVRSIGGVVSAAAYQTTFSVAPILPQVSPLFAGFSDTALPEDILV